MSQKYRFQDVDEKSRQIFRQFDHGKGYITVDVRLPSRQFPSLLSLILCGCSPKRAVATVTAPGSLSARMRAVAGRCRGVQEDGAVRLTADGTRRVLRGRLGSARQG